nr:carbohydrate kinase family protein [Candidatus Paceibacterota bacterium]
SVNCNIDNEKCQICIRFGDKVPYESVDVVNAVGNSPNAAVSAARLGMQSGLLAVVGKDRNGEECIETLKQNNVSTEYIEIDQTLPTNYHYVLWYDVERTILVNHALYERKLDMNIPAPEWLYVSSLASNTLPFHAEIIEYLEANPTVKLAFQPGTFQMLLGKDKLASMYKHSDIFFCNKEEAQRILENDEPDISKLLDSMYTLGPKMVVITDGIDGAYVRKEDGQKLFMPIFPHAPFERTGAGDAFSSTFAIAIAKGKTVEEALMWAPINAMSVTLHVGAQKGLLTEQQILEYLKDAPADYKPHEI